MPKINDLIAKSIALKLKDIKFIERISNTIDWRVEDFDNNFSDVIDELLIEMLKEAINDYRESIKEMLLDELSESMDDKIKKAIKNFSIEISNNTFYDGLCHD